jgi:hypothetical protein
MKTKKIKYFVSIGSRLTGLLSLSLYHSLSLCPSKLLYKSVTIAFQPKTKITNFKQICPIYQMYRVIKKFLCTL